MNTLKTKCYCFVLTGTCLCRLYVLAFTSSRRYGSSFASHFLEVKIRGKRLVKKRLGSYKKSNKGDLWKFNFNPSLCVRIRDIQRVAIAAANRNSWNIDSIVTMVKDRKGKTFILTQNLDVFRWISKSGDISRRRFQLTFA